MADIFYPMQLGSALAQRTAAARQLGAHALQLYARVQRTQASQAQTAAVARQMGAHALQLYARVQRAQAALEDSQKREAAAAQEAEAARAAAKEAAAREQAAQERAEAAASALPELSGSAHPLPWAPACLLCCACKSSISLCFLDNAVHLIAGVQAQPCTLSCQACSQACQAPSLGAGAAS